MPLIHTKCGCYKIITPKYYFIVSFCDQRRIYYRTAMQKVLQQKNNTIKKLKK
jgi:hypothetical protein